MLAAVGAELAPPKRKRMLLQSDNAVIGGGGPPFARDEAKVFSDSRLIPRLRGIHGVGSRRRDDRCCPPSDLPLACGLSPPNCRKKACAVVCRFRAGPID